MQQKLRPRGALRAFRRRARAGLSVYVAVPRIRDDVASLRLPRYDRSQKFIGQKKESTGPWEWRGTTFAALA